MRHSLPYLCGRMLKHGSSLMSVESYIGIAAGVCTAVSLLPQLIKIIREKKAENISYFMIAILLLGLAGWIAYGFLRKDAPLILTNIFSFIVNVLMMIFSVKYKPSAKDK